MNTLLHQQEGAVLFVTLNRPETRNAMSLEMVGELLTTLRQAEADASVRVVVLRGAGGHFCSGADLKDMAAARMRLANARPDEPDPVAETNAAFGRMCLAYARTALPVVAAAEGTVMGGGFGLACVADVTLATQDAVFRLPETSLGVVPAQIAPFLIQRLGLAEARRLAVTGGRIDAQEALTLRLVHRVAPDAAGLEEVLRETLDRILACAPAATAATKDLIQRAHVALAQGRLEELVEDAARVFSAAAQGPEGQEGLSAFLEKRIPAWAPAARR